MSIEADVEKVKKRDLAPALPSDLRPQSVEDELSDPDTIKMLSDKTDSANNQGSSKQ